MWCDVVAGGFLVSVGALWLVVWVGVGWFTRVRRVRVGSCEACGMADADGLTFIESSGRVYAWCGRCREEALSLLR